MKHIKIFESFGSPTQQGGHKVVQCVITFSSVEIDGDETVNWPVSTHTITTEFLNQGSEKANKEAVIRELIAGAYEIGGDPLWCDQLEAALSKESLGKMAEKAGQKSDPLGWFLDDLAYGVSSESSLAEYWQRPENREVDEYGEVYDPEESLVFIYNEEGLEPKVEFKILRDNLSPEDVKMYQAMYRLRKRII